MEEIAKQIYEAILKKIDDFELHKYELRTLKVNAYVEINNVEQYFKIFKEAKK